MGYETLISLVMVPIFILMVAHVITGSRRKRSECPKCGKKNYPKKTLVVDQTTGEEVEGERDFEYALVIAMIGIFIGAGLWIVAFQTVLPGLVNEFAVSGMVVIANGLLIEFFSLLIVGLTCIWYSLGKIRRIIATRGNPMTCYFQCPSCKHTWTEAVAARA